MDTNIEKEEVLDILPDDDSKNDVKESEKETVVSSEKEELLNKINEEAEKEEIEEGKLETTTEEKEESVKEDTISTPEEVKEEEIDISDLAGLYISSISSSESAIGNLDDPSGEEESISIKNFNKIKNMKKGNTNNSSESKLINSDVFNDEEMSFDDPEDEDLSADEALTEEAKNEDKREYTFLSGESKNGNNHKLDFMDSINVDLNNIDIIEKPAINQIQDTSYIFEDNVPTFRVVCCQSAYSACLSGLTLAERNAINNSNLDLYQSKQKLYKTVYNKIQSMNFDKPKFDEWLKITSLGDWNTLLFGIYCQTFIDNNDFDITCGHCGKSTSVNIDNQSLAEAKDRGVFDMIEKVTSGPMTPQQLVENSLVHKSTRVMLKESKMIVDIHTPSLWDNLALIRASKPEVIQQYADTFSAMLFIGHLYQLDVKATYDKKQPTYYELKERSTILNTLLKLSSTDGEQLEDAIEDKLSKYNITYELHNCKCQHCNEKLPNIPIDMETILFTRINKERKKATN